MRLFGNRGCCSFFGEYNGSVCVCDSLMFCGDKCEFHRSSDNIASTCDDGDPCTMDDKCVDGMCRGDPRPCAEHAPPCQLSACDSSTGLCVTTFTSAPCEDGLRCTVADTCSDGACRSGPVRNCSDGRVCTDDMCDPRTGECIFVHNTAACDDGVNCTVRDRCLGGICAGVPLVCGPSAEQCGIDKTACIEATGKCGISNDTSLRPCSDGDACTVHDVCVGTVCVGVPRVCSDGNACTHSSCRSLPDGTFVCDHIPAPGRPCDDGLRCTRNDTCGVTSICAGLPVLCDDGNACTDDSCDPSTGRCIAENTTGGPCEHPNRCLGAGTCRNGTCASAANVCDDGNACTRDTCTVRADGTHNCTHTALPVGSPCFEHTDPCALSPTCTLFGGVNLVCFGALNLCPSDDPCNDGTCDPDTVRVQR